MRKIPENTNYFEFNNMNPKNNATGDCVIRALALFLDKSWDEVYVELFNIGLKYKLMPNSKRCYKKYLKNLGYDMCKQPRKYDNTKYTGVDFCEKLQKENDNKKYLCHIGGHHIVCIVNGKVNDIWDSTYGCIGNYWV